MIVNFKKYSLETTALATISEQKVDNVLIQLLEYLSFQYIDLFDNIGNL